MRGGLGVHFMKVGEVKRQWGHSDSCDLYCVVGPRLEKTVQDKKRQAPMGQAAGGT